MIKVGGIVYRGELIGIYTETDKYFYDIPIDVLKEILKGQSKNIKEILDSLILTNERIFVNEAIAQYIDNEDFDGALHMLRGNKECIIISNCPSKDMIGVLETFDNFLKFLERLRKDYRLKRK